MDRRQTLKALAVGALASGMLLEACKTADKKAEGEYKAGPVPEGPDRQPNELEHLKKVTATTFFTAHEMATIAVLADIIIPRDDVSGSATDARVPDFIEFIVKDMPDYQAPMRDGLKWMDEQSGKMFSKSFKDAKPEQQIQLVDLIAYPAKAKPEMEKGVAFFSTMRDLTCTGFYTTEMGVKDIGYKGNQPNQWNGVPDDVLKQYGLAYTEKELKECVKFS